MLKSFSNQAKTSKNTVFSVGVCSYDHVLNESRGKCDGMGWDVAGCGWDAKRDYSDRILGNRDLNTSGGPHVARESEMWISCTLAAISCRARHAGQNVYIVSWF